MNKGVKKGRIDKEWNLRLDARYSHFSLEREWNLYQIEAISRAPIRVIRESVKIYEAIS